MKKILPISDSPINSYPEHSFLLSVLNISENYLPWFYSNFVQIYADKADSEIQYFYDFYIPLRDNYIEYNPCLLTEVIRRESILNKDIIELIIEYINQGYYIYFPHYIDLFYFSGCRHYQKNHFTHSMLIYGYDDNEKTLEMAGFLKEGKFSFSKINFDEFEKAFYSPSYKEYLDRIVFFKYKEKDDYEFDLINLTELIKDYLESNNSSERYRSFKKPVYKFYGISVYDCLIDDMRNDNYKIDIRPFHVLWEHKKTMKSRVKYLNENNIITEDLDFNESLEYLEKECLIARNNMIKYRLTQNKRILVHVINILKEVRDTENRILKALLNKLKA